MGLQKREAKDGEARDLHRECRSLGGLALWMETMMDSIEMKVLEALQEAITLPEEEGVEVTGEEEVT